MEQSAKPIVFKCPATGIDVISPVRAGSDAFSDVDDRPLILPCFCGASHAVYLKRFKSKKSAVRNAIELPTG
jgi:hypothetical protein